MKRRTCVSLIHNLISDIPDICKFFSIISSFKASFGFIYFQCPKVNLNSWTRFDADLKFIQTHSFHLPFSFLPKFSFLHCRWPLEMRIMLSGVFLFHTKNEEKRKCIYIDGIILCVILFFVCFVYGWHACVLAKDVWAKSYLFAITIVNTSDVSMSLSEREIRMNERNRTKLCWAATKSKKKTDMNGHNKVYIFIFHIVQYSSATNKYWFYDQHAQIKLRTRLNIWSFVVSRFYFCKFFWKKKFTIYFLFQILLFH